MPPSAERSGNLPIAGRLRVHPAEKQPDLARNPRLSQLPSLDQSSEQCCKRLEVRETRVVGCASEGLHQENCGCRSESLRLQQGRHGAMEKLVSNVVDRLVRQPEALSQERQPGRFAAPRLCLPQPPQPLRDRLAQLLPRFLSTSIQERRILETAGKLARFLQAGKRSFRA